MATILTSQLPSKGYGYTIPSVNVSPMNFMEICKYLENVPTDPLDKYLYDVEMLRKEDPRIMNLYVMDVDFLIFYKKLCTVSSEMSYTVSATCPICGSTIQKKISLNKDIHFKQLDEKVMNGCLIEINGHKYETIIPTMKDFLKVFELYLKYKKTDDLKLIKTVALIKDFEYQGNQVENDIFGATHEDITLLLALRELYYDRLEPIEIICPECKKEGKEEIVAVSVDSLIVDFFRDLCINSPIDGSKILFK